MPQTMSAFTQCSFPRVILQCWPHYVTLGPVNSLSSGSTMNDFFPRDGALIDLPGLEAVTEYSKRLITPLLSRLNPEQIVWLFRA